MKNGNLVTTIEIKDRQGRVVETKEVVTYAGLLDRAHQEGLKKVLTELIQVPSKTNEMTAICMAEVMTDKGAYRDYGDANPTNVSSMIVPHIIRMAVTRAKARALRDAVNIGVVALEELGTEYLNGAVDNKRKQSTRSGKETKAASPGDDNGKTGNSPATNTVKNSQETEQDNSSPEDNKNEDPMTDSQRRFLFRLLAERGITGESAHDWLKQQLDIESLREASKRESSELINDILNGKVLEKGVTT